MACDLVATSCSQIAGWLFRQRWMDLLYLLHNLRIFLIMSCFTDSDALSSSVFEKFDYSDRISDIVQDHHVFWLATTIITKFWLMFQLMLVSKLLLFMNPKSFYSWLMWLLPSDFTVSLWLWLRNLSSLSSVFVSGISNTSLVSSHDSSNCSDIV